MTTEIRFVRDARGRVFTEHDGAYDFWRRYLDVFEEVMIVARARDVDVAPSSLRRVDGPGVRLFALPHAVGLLRLALSAPELRSRLRALRGVDGVAILRVPGVIGTLFGRWSRVRPFAVEVVGDPAEVFAPGASRLKVAPLVRVLASWLLRRQCLAADAGAYVTQRQLQSIYPLRADRFSTTYSSVRLEEEDYAEPTEQSGSVRRIVGMGSLQQPYKGVDLLIDALAELGAEAGEMHVRWLGGGRLLEELRARARERGIEDRFHLVGAVSDRATVRAELDAADLYVQPSRTEGLPRALIEAMARGRLCLGASVGGIPELLDERFLVEPDVASWAAALRRVARLSTRECSAVAALNYERALHFREEAQRERRVDLYEELIRLKQS